jgi:hypothetical protein
MNEIELLRHDYAAIPEPDSRSVARARDSLLRTQASLTGSRPFRPRLFLAFALAIAATTVIALEYPFGNSGVDVARADPAAAGFRALSAKTGVWHYRSLSTLSEGSRSSERDITEGWSTARDLPWFAHSVTERTPAGGSGWIDELTNGHCGTIYWSGPSPGVLRVISQRVLAEPDPVEDYRRAYLRGTVISQTATTYHGIPAYRLVFDLGEWRQTWTIRRSDYVPLQRSGIDTKIGPVPRSYTTTYTLFELLPPTADTLAHLRPQQHPGARVLRYGGKPLVGCTRFGR